MHGGLTIFNPNLHFQDTLLVGQSVATSSCQWHVIDIESSWCGFVVSCWHIISSHNYTPTMVCPQQTICMPLLDSDHLCLSICWRLVFIGDQKEQLSLESHLSNPCPHRSLTNQRKLLQLSSAFPNDPASFPAAIPVPCSQPQSRFKAKPNFSVSCCNPILMEAEFF